MWSCLILNMKTKYLLSAILFVLLVSLIWIFNSKKRNPDQTQIIENNLEQFRLSPQVVIDYNNSILINSVLKTSSNENPEIKIVIFTDPLCPDCNKLIKNVIELDKLHLNNSLKINLKFFPLSQSCNSKIKFKGHSLSCDLALLNLCLENDETKNKEITIKLIEWSALLNDKKIDQIKEKENILKIFGVSEADFKKCESNSKIRERLKQMIKEAGEIKATSLPALFINGKRFFGFREESALLKALSQ